MVFPFLFLILLSWSHYSGIATLFLANNIATVLPYLFYKLGLWYHSYGGTIPLEASNIATVFLFSLIYSGSCKYY